MHIKTIYPVRRTSISFRQHWPVSVFSLIMAGRLLFVIIIMYFFSETQIQALSRPKLVVRPLMITETDSVALDCETSDGPVSQCYYFIGRQETVKAQPCLKVLTGADLLLKSHQRSPAEVEVSCFYATTSNVPSLHSDTSFITIHSEVPELDLQHFDGDIVLFTCSVPGSAKDDTKCNLYFGEANRPVTTTSILKQRSQTKQRFCQFTVSITDLLRHLLSVQQKAASCDYTLGSKPRSLSPRSDGRNLTDIVEKESNSASILTTGLTDSRPNASTFVSPVKPASEMYTQETDTTVENKPYTTQTRGQTVSKPQASTAVTTVKLPSGQTVSKPQVSTAVTTVKLPSDQTVSKPQVSTAVTTVKLPSGRGIGKPKITSSFTLASLTPVKPALETATATVSTTMSVTSPNKTSAPAGSFTKNWILIVIVSLSGVAVGVTLLGLVILCYKRITGHKPITVADEVMCMRNTDHGGLLPDEGYSVITSVPGAGRPTGSEKLSRQKPQMEDSIYHVYATISVEPAASALNSVSYSTS